MTTKPGAAGAVCGRTLDGPGPALSGLARLIVPAALVVLIALPICPAAVGSEARVIEWGWRTPPPIYVADHIRSMERQPFDGIVLDIPSNDGREKMAWQAWSSQPLDERDFSQSIEALQRIEFHRFTDNFLRFNVTPGDVDWFDPSFASVLANARTVARIAACAHLRGIFFDVEAYQSKLFSYDWLIQHGGQASFDAYRSQVRRQGAAIAQALASQNRPLDIILTYGYALGCGTDPGASVPLEKEARGLLPSFLDGMLDGLPPGVTMYDGWEYSYGYRTAAEYARARRTIEHPLCSAHALEPSFNERYKASFGVWLDQGKRWDSYEHANNYFTPAQFEESVRQAILHTDRYVWIYSEKADWWRTGVPPDYVEAIERSRQPK